jgi:general secretion pathway protein D
VETRLRLRDGESNLLAGLLREEDRRSISGIPGLIRIPILRNLFASNVNRISQTDIVMLLTPRIVRTQELTLEDVSPIFIGSQQSLGLGGPPPLIAAPAVDETPTAFTPVTPVVVPPAVTPGAPGAAGVVVVPPGSSQVPGTTTLPAAPAQPVAPAPQPGNVAPAAGTPQGAVGGTPPVAATGTPTGGQILLSPPGPEFRVGAGPYTVPVSIAGASQLSSVTLTITFNPAALRVRVVQEGSFLRTGGVQAAFTQQVDAASGRVDMAIVRTGDQTGVAGTGLLAAIVFDAVGGGAANLSVTGAAAGPRGTPVSLQFGQVPAVTVR